MSTHAHALAASVLMASMAPTTLAQSCGDFGETDAAALALLAANPSLEGVSVILGDRDGIIYEAHLGGYDADTVVPVASASKLLSGVAIMTLIDQGAIDPDAPVRDYLPTDFSITNAGVKSGMTVRQMFAHISGLPPEDAFSDILGNQTITLEEAVRHIACCVSLRTLPGNSFGYGGLSMHVAGRVAEVVSGQPWEAFVTSTLVDPLGLNSIDYQGLGPTTNPRVSGSAQTSVTDYARVLRMLLRGGELDGTRLLSEAAVADMIADRTVGLPVVYTPEGSEGWGYGFGGWVSRVDNDGSTIEFTSPGAFGCTPWIDLERGIYGIIMVEGVRRNMVEELDAVKAAAEAAIDACAQPCVADFAEPFGSLDFFDIAAFISGYNAGSPDADLALPIGTLNFFDVAEYIARFNAGCP